MANALGTLASALIIQRALALTFTKRPMLRYISLDLGQDSVKWNQQVISRIKSVPAVADFGTGAADVTLTDVSVTINQFKEIHHAFTPQEYTATDRRLVDEIAEPMAVAFANHIVDAVAALWIAANFTNSSTVASGWSYTNTLLVLRKALIGRGIPDGYRFVACNADVYGAFLADTTIVAALNNPSNGDAIRRGMLPQVAGFGLDEYPALPTTGNMVAFAGSSDSTVYAARVPKDPREVLPGASFPGNLSVVTDPTTGLSVMVNEWIDPATLKANCRLVWMYGVAKGNANNGQILKTA